MGDASRLSPDPTTRCNSASPAPAPRRAWCAADQVIEALADEAATLREANRQLIDLVADLSFENSMLRICYERELLARIHGDKTIAMLQRHLHQRAA